MVHGQEVRADCAAALVAGGDAAAPALAKVAPVQPIFRKVLDYYDSSDPDPPNLYASFRAFWDRLPDPLQSSLRHALLADRRGPIDPAHPPSLDRLALLQSYPGAGPPPAISLRRRQTRGAWRRWSKLPHNRLLSLARIEPSVFHRAGS